MQRSESLKKNQDFQKVYRNGTSKGNRYLVMYVLKNQYMKNRLGISVSKKVGNSVVRHRLTRLIRESYRLNEAEFENSLDIVVVARPQAKDRTYQEIESALMHLAGKHCIAGKTGIELQRACEAAAYRLGGSNWNAPAQLVGDFLAGRASKAPGKVKPTYPLGVTWTAIDEALPQHIVESLRLGLPLLGKKLRGYDRSDAVLTGS